MEPEISETLALHLHRWTDGSTTLQMTLTEDTGYDDYCARRTYRPGTDLGDVIDDSSRMLSGWGALGVWGLIDTVGRLTVKA